MKKFLISICLLLVVGLIISCVKKSDSTRSATSGTAADEAETPKIILSEEIELVENIELPAKETEKLFNLKVYNVVLNYDDVFTRNYIYYIVPVSFEKILSDTYEYAKSLGFDGYHNIWYEGNKLYVDMTSELVNKLDGLGNLGAASAFSSMLYTFLSFPDVEEMQFLFNGSDERHYFDHFSWQIGTLNAAEQWRFFRENDFTFDEEANNVFNKSFPNDIHNAQFTLPITLYLPDKEYIYFETRAAYTDGSLSHIVSLLANEYAIPPGTEILSFNIVDRIGYADMNSVYADSLKNMGTTGEIFLLYSLVNTLISFFDVDSIMLTEEGGMLVASHFEIDSPLGFFDK